MGFLPIVARFSERSNSMAYTAADLRKGLRVEIEGVPYLITEFTFVKPGKGAAIYTCKMKNLVNGSTLTRAYRDNATIDAPNLEEKNMRYSYADGDQFVFTDEGYNEIHIPAEVLGDSKRFLVDDMPVQALFHNSRAIGITMPIFVEKTIIHTEPGARGNTANNVLKPAQIEGGYEIMVPLFVNQGDRIRLDTRSGEYVDRVSNR